MNVISAIKQTIFAKNLRKMTACLPFLFAGNSWAEALLNVSYDPTREFYKAYNQLFETHWQQQGNATISVQTSHGGSGKQARAVIDGLQADIATLALAGDIDALNKYRQLIDPNWQQRLPNNSTPYTSTIVFLVRKGNPKQIHDWNDLIRDEIEVITPNPKTSGGARWNFLAAWAYAKEKFGRDDKAQAFVTEVYRHTPILDAGARGATMSFVQRGLGDVLLAWENEAHLALQEQGGSEFEIIVPSVSILAEPSVALIDSVVDKKGTRQAAQAYLEYLYSDEAQRLAAQNFYRPSNAKILAEYQAQFPALKLRSLNDLFGAGWSVVQPRFFNDGGVFDHILEEIYRE